MKTPTVGNVLKQILTMNIYRVILGITFICNCFLAQAQVGNYKKIKREYERIFGKEYGLYRYDKTVVPNYDKKLRSIINRNDSIFILQSINPGINSYAFILTESGDYFLSHDSTYNLVKMDMRKYGRLICFRQIIENFDTSVLKEYYKEYGPAENVWIYCIKKIKGKIQLVRFLDFACDFDWVNDEKKKRIWIKKMFPNSRGLSK